MTKIAILTPCIEHGDAVSNDVIGMYQVLRSEGHPVHVFANNWFIEEPKIEHVSKIDPFLTHQSDLLIYHFSVGWDLGLNILLNAKCNKIIKYHNITPPEFFDSVNQDYANVCRAGRKQLKDIANIRCERYLADSEYNMGELVTEGADQTKCVVLPPFHHIDRLRAINANLRALDACRDGKTNIVTVGRLSPNKGHATLIEAFATFYYHYDVNSRLLIIGKEDARLHPYTTLLRERIHDLDLDRAVIFTGAVPDETLKAYYLMAHVFMTTSEHEGFCVPLVEAMAMKIPIVAYGTSAIPGTVGKAGIVWDQPDPFLLAGSVDHILKDDSLNFALCEMGWRRYRDQFTNEKIKNLFLDILQGII